MPEVRDETENAKKGRVWEDPSLDSERESDVTRERRMERETKRGEEPQDLREND